jgi:biotin operon repressor
MNRSALKRAILQHLLKHQGEWTYGKTLGSLFSCNRRQYENAIESLRFQKYPIIADKSKGYKITYNIQERLDYYNRREKEIKVQLASIKTMRARDESGELFAQDFVIKREMEKECA